MSITHLEVRRHPLWKEQAVPESRPDVRRSAGVGMALIAGGVVALLTALALVIFA